MQKITKQIKDNLVADLREFIRKTGFTDVTFGLSGGMDSALVLALACEALGAQHVHTMMMKTKFTSQLSIDLANQIAENFGNPHENIDIQSRLDAKLNNLSFVPKNNLTIENMQSRDRSDLCMTYSSEFKRLVLGCSNKSEIMMGYCTLYGDTVGAVAPLGDLFKTNVYKMAELYPQIPREIITRPASAELSFNQKDTDSMPPYEILDPILSAIEAGNPNSIENKELLGAIEKRVKINEFKRAVMPPVLKIRG
ncbi:MAG: NAD(+) synthase [Rickettsiales bacterium]|jgi:NAD+ synthetase|nr:NAD(+) synthase [Rickettsiales bacterium]